MAIAHKTTAADDGFTNHQRSQQKSSKFRKCLQIEEHAIQLLCMEANFKNFNNNQTSECDVS
jgi:hypothetical protein